MDVSCLLLKINYILRLEKWLSNQIRAGAALSDDLYLIYSTYMVVYNMAVELTHVGAREPNSGPSEMQPELLIA